MDVSFFLSIHRIRSVNMAIYRCFYVTALASVAWVKRKGKGKFSSLSRAPEFPLLLPVLTPATRVTYTAISRKVVGEKCARDNPER